MTADPAIEVAARALALADLGSTDWHHWRHEAAVVVAAVRPVLLEQAAQAVEGERMPKWTEEMRRNEPYWRGYDAAICDTLDAVRALAGTETQA